MPEVLDTGYSISNLTFLFVKNKRSKFHYHSKNLKISMVKSLAVCNYNNGREGGGCGSVGTLLA